MLKWHDKKKREKRKEKKREIAMSSSLPNKGERSS
jgi:hypothetical protein